MFAGNSFIVKISGVHFGVLQVVYNNYEKS